MFAKETHKILYIQLQESRYLGHFNMQR